MIAAIDILAWLCIHLGVSYAVTRMPARLFDPDFWPYRARWPVPERELYERIFHIRLWKRLIPDGAALFRGSFRKKNLAAKDSAYIERFIQETCRGECAHWVTVSFAPLFFLWNPDPVGWIMVLYAVAANAPCIITQRYNRFRMQKLLQEKKQRGSCATQRKQGFCSSWNHRTGNLF